MQVSERDKNERSEVSARLRRAFVLQVFLGMSHVRAKRGFNDDYLECRNRAKRGYDALRLFGRFFLERVVNGRREVSTTIIFLGYRNRAKGGYDVRLFCRFWKEF